MDKNELYNHLMDARRAADLSQGAEFLSRMRVILMRTKNTPYRVRNWHLADPAKLVSYNLTQDEFNTTCEMVNVLSDGTDAEAQQYIATVTLTNAMVYLRLLVDECYIFFGACGAGAVAPVAPVAQPAAVAATNMKEDYQLSSRRVVNTFSTTLPDGSVCYYLDDNNCLVYRSAHAACKKLCEDFKKILNANAMEGASFNRMKHCGGQPLFSFLHMEFDQMIQDTAKALRTPFEDGRSIFVDGAMPTHLHLGSAYIHVVYLSLLFLAASNETGENIEQLFLSSSLTFWRVLKTLYSKRGPAALEAIRGVAERNWTTSQDFPRPFCTVLAHFDCSELSGPELRWRVHDGSQEPRSKSKRSETPLPTSQPPVSLDTHEDMTKDAMWVTLGGTFCPKCGRKGDCKGDCVMKHAGRFYCINAFTKRVLKGLMDPGKSGASIKASYLPSRIVLLKKS